MLTPQSIETLRSKLKDPTFDDFFESLIFFTSSSTSPNSDSFGPDPLYNTAMTIIHPDSGDASSEKKERSPDIGHIRKSALDSLAKQIETIEMTLGLRLSALESLARSASVPSVAPSEAVPSVRVNDDPDNPLDKPNIAAPLLNREAIDQINLELLSLNRYRDLWQGYTRALDQVQNLDGDSSVTGAPSLVAQPYVHHTYKHHGLRVCQTSGDGHCFLRALKDDLASGKEMERTQILLGEGYKEGGATTPGSFEWVKKKVHDFYSKNAFEALRTLFHVSTNDNLGGYLDVLMTQYFDEKEYASGNIGHFVDTIPTIVFKELARETKVLQYIIKLRWDDQSGTPQPQFMLYTFNDDEESCRSFEDASSLMVHLNSLGLTPQSRVVFNSGIHYEPVVLTRSS